MEKTTASAIYSELQDFTAKALFEQATALHQQGQFEQAKRIYTQVLRHEPKHFDALRLLGVTELQSGHPLQALESIDAAIEINPNRSDAYYDRGVALFDLKRFEDAVASYDNAIALNANYADAYLSRGNALFALSKFEEAALSYERALQIDPENVGAYSNRGAALSELQRWAEALDCYNKAIELQPNFVDALLNRGNALYLLNRLEESIVCFDRVLELSPNHPGALCNRGNVLLSLNCLDQAKETYDRAIELQPEFAAEIHTSKARLILMSADFERGWPLYEWRWKERSLVDGPKFSKPLWLGEEDLANKTILLHAEQGLGDTIQFCRYAKLVKAKGARVVMGVPRALLALLQGLEGVDEWVIENQSVPAFDYHCPLLSLPLAFKTDLKTIPSPGPYLKADANKCNTWAQRLGEKTKPRVGLVWSGSTIHKNDRNRSMRLQDVLQHLPAGCEYVSLQKELREIDKEVLASSSVKFYGDELLDFTDTAALCAQMDVVVSVDTSVAHLAAALGKTTWLMLPFVPDWRWLLEREDSPWYASMRLYRQGADRQWVNVLQRVAADLVLLGGR